MTILAIDPGPEYSAWVILKDGIPTMFGLDENKIILDHIREGEFNVQELAIEMIASYGMAVGKTVFNTCVWIGKFEEAFDLMYGEKITRVFRKEVCMHICNSPRAKDSNIRQALIDRFGPPGTKKDPGVLYGVKKDIWAALAVGVTHYDKEK